MIKLIHLSNIVMLSNSKSGFGVVNVKGFNLFPKPAQSINAVLIRIEFPFKILYQ